MTAQRTDLSRELRLKTILARSKKNSSGRFAVGGREKQPQNLPTAVTLPRFKALERTDDREDQR